MRVKSNGVDPNVLGHSAFVGLPLAVLAGFLSSRLIPQSMQDMLSECILFIHAGRASFLTNYTWQWSLVVGIVGYFWGIRSYQNVCMDKLMHLEHSGIADLKRKTIAMKYCNPYFNITVVLVIVLLMINHKTCI